MAADIVGGVIGGMLYNAVQTPNYSYIKGENQTNGTSTGGTATAKVAYYDTCPQCGGASGGEKICPYCDSSLAYTVE